MQQPLTTYNATLPHYAVAVFITNHVIFPREELPKNYSFIYTRLFREFSMVWNGETKY